MTVILTALERLDEALILIREGLKEAATVITPELKAHDFYAMSKQLGELNGLLNARSVITTTIGFLADKHHSGSEVGSRTPETYIMNLLTVSRTEARRMINRGKDTYAPPALAEISKELRTAHNCTEEDCNSPSDNDKNTPGTLGIDLEQRRREFEQAKKVREEEKKAQDQAAELLVNNSLGEEYLQILDSELRHLQGIIHRQTIRAKALQKAPELTPTEFRYCVRDLVKRSNAQHHDPHTGFKRRYIAIGKPDADGGARITGYLPGPTLALFEQALAAANRPDPTTRSQLASSNPAVTDSNTAANSCCKTSLSTAVTAPKEQRKLGQRRVDTLAHILRNHVSSSSSRHSGVGSLVVSITTDELHEILDETNGARLTQLIHKPRPTNTAAQISLVELMSLGLATFDIACLHDSTTGNALYLGRTKRSASFWQKIALVAEQLVCSHPGCDVPAVNCEVHHIKSWISGGETDIDNLTLLCRNHHMDNNDRKDPRTPRGWAESDPVTGRKGHQDLPQKGSTALPPVRINTGWMAKQAAGYKIFTTQKQPDISHTDISDKEQKRSDSSGFSP